MTYYKVLRENRVGIYSHTLWSMPVKQKDGSWEPAEWMPKIEQLWYGFKGYHLCTLPQLPKWNHGPLLCVAEGRGNHKNYGEEDKIVKNGICWQEVRLLRIVENWNARTRRLFVCDCVERALGDTAGYAPARQALEMSRRYARGFITQEEWDNTKKETIKIGRLINFGKKDSDKVNNDAVFASCWDARDFAVDELTYAYLGNGGCAEYDGECWLNGWYNERLDEHWWRVERLRQYLDGELS